jgi:methylase of polypeptide subunit release factors
LADLEDVPGAAVSDWVTAGLAGVHRRTVQPLASIQPFRMGTVELRLVSEAQNPSFGGPSFQDFVLGVSRTSSQLAQMTLRRPFARALDVGTGNGVQAILASRHCQSVVATDVNPRALAFTRFNLAFNDVVNVDLRQGDRYEPVRAETFDLVVCNPPFVVSPASAVQFRDSGLPTDTISATAVTGVAEHLAPGGWAQIMCQWAHYDGTRWQDRVANWVAETGCDTWAVQYAAQDVVSHTVAWLTELGRADPKEADRQFGQWMNYFDSEGIVGLGSGFVVLRKTINSAPWFVPSELGIEPADEAGEAVATLFETQDWLRANPEPAATLDARWRLAEHVRLDATQGATAQGTTANGHILKHGNGLRTSVQITRDLAEIVTKCDGSLPLRTIVRDHVEGRWRDPPRHEAEIETAFRRLVEGGFVVLVKGSQ